MKVELEEDAGAPAETGITLDAYFADSIDRGYQPTDQERRNAADLLTAVNNMLDQFGERREMNNGHRTREKTLDMRAKGYAAALGGAHETAEGIDLEDEDGALKEWLAGNQHVLMNHGLYMEHPSATRRYVHVQTRAPRSGRRVFFP